MKMEKLFKISHKNIFNAVKESVKLHRWRKQAIEYHDRKHCHLPPGNITPVCFAEEQRFS